VDEIEFLSYLDLPERFETGTGLLLLPRPDEALRFIPLLSKMDLRPR
jgi:hypothetical protein